MALLYSQNWAAGNSTFTSYNVYKTPAQGGAHAVDPLYPEIIQAESVTIGVGEGPSGENVLKWSGTYGDWQTSGVYIALTPWNASAGRVTFQQYFSTAMLAVAAYMPLFWVSAGTTHPDIVFGFYLDTPGDPSVGYLDIGNQPGLDPVSGPIDFSPYENTWVTVDLCWALGAPGHARVQFNGTTLFEVTPTLVTTGAGGTQADSIAFGSDGLAGPLTNIRVFDTGCDVSVEVPDGDDSVPCCGTKADPGDGGTTPGDTIGPNPHVTLPPWIQACAGGGTVPTAADLTDAENWAA